MKNRIVFIAVLSAGWLAAPLHLRADDAAASTTAAPAIGKRHMDVNAWLDAHPKLKAKVLAKFDTNHDGKLEGDEIPPFLKWLKERQEKRKALKEDGGDTTKATPPAITSPTVSQ